MGSSIVWGCCDDRSKVRSDSSNASNGFQPCFFDAVLDERFINGYPVTDRMGRNGGVRGDCRMMCRKTQIDRRL